jgi:lipopolysaccharide export system ATP-binding protein
MDTVPMALFSFGSKKTPVTAGARGRSGPPTLPGYAPPIPFGTAPFEAGPFDERAAAFAEADGYNGGNFADPPQSTAPDAYAAHDPHAEPIGGDGYLTAHGVQKAYKKRKVVKGVSLGVARGESVGLLGPNGAGKTTTFYMITGLVGADAGRITIDGRDVTRLPMYRRARLGIGYLPQEASIFRGLSVEQNIMAVLELTEPKRKVRKERLDQLLEEFKITRLRKSPSMALSGGERRRCEIARALASNPSFMLLDEPFAGIDPLAVGDIQELVRHLTRRGIGVLITDHNVRETLSLVDRAYVIADGQVLTHGSPEEVVANPDVRRVYLGDMFG